MREVSYREGPWSGVTAGRRLWYRIWGGASARRLLIVCHGFFEHGGRYEAFGRALAGQGVCVAVFDLWGHGRSGGRRGDVTVEEAVRDLAALTTEVFLPEARQTTYRVFGHSYGGLVAIHAALEAGRGLRRVVIQSPLLAAGVGVPSWRLAAGRVLARWWPTLTVPSGLDRSTLSRDASAVRAYEADPLVHDRMSGRAFQSIERAGATAIREAAGIRVPVLLLSGGADRLVSRSAIGEWFERLTCEKRHQAFEDCYHELQHESVRADVERLVSEWVSVDG